MKIKAVVFDAYGTLFDVYSIQVLAEAFYPGQGADIAVKWRDKQIEYTRLVTQSDPHSTLGSQYFRPFWELTRLSLEYTSYPSQKTWQCFKKSKTWDSQPPFCLMAVWTCSLQPFRAQEWQVF